MKNYYFSWVLGLWALCSPSGFTADAPTPLEKLQKIVSEPYKLAEYDEKEECESLIKNQTNETSSIKFTGEISNQSNSLICTKIPQELLAYMCSKFLDIRSINLGFGLTCRKFYDISQSSGLYPTLTPYFLTETRPLTVDRDVVRTRTFNTKDGIFKLASLYCVEPEHLREWFTPDELSVFIKGKIIPGALANLPEDEILTLYPVMKTSLATSSDEKYEKLLEGLSEKQESLGASRLLSLKSDFDNNKRYDVLKNLLQVLFNQPSHCYGGDIDYTPYGVIFRKILRSASDEVLRNASFFDDIVLKSWRYASRSQAQEFARKLYTWFAEHHQQYSKAVGTIPILAKLGYDLSCRNLVSKILLGLFSLPNDDSNIQEKLDVVSSLFHNSQLTEDVQASEMLPHIKALFKSLKEESSWGKLDRGNQFTAFNLMVLFGEHEGVCKALDQFLSEPDLSMFIQCINISKLFQYKEREGGKRVIEALLSQEVDKLIPYKIHNLPEFFDCAVKIAPEKTMFVVRNLLDANEEWEGVKGFAHLHEIEGSPLAFAQIQTLAWLARYKGNEEADVIRSRLKTWELQGKPNWQWNSSYFSIYYHLKDAELCGTYYQKIVDWMGPNKEETDKLCKILRGQDLKTVLLEDLKAQDPFNVMRILSSDQYKTLSDIYFHWEELFDTVAPYFKDKQ